MKKFPKPWHRPSRGVWYVTLNGKQVNLGPDKDAAFERYRQLLGQPRHTTVGSESLGGVIDAFLDFTQKHRSPETYTWYQYRLQYQHDSGRVRHPRLPAG